MRLTTPGVPAARSGGTCNDVVQFVRAMSPAQVTELEARLYLSFPGVWQTTKGVLQALHQLGPRADDLLYGPACRYQFLTNLLAWCDQQDEAGTLPLTRAHEDTFNHEGR